MTICIFVGISKAQSSEPFVGTIRGKAVDAQGSPVVGARVILSREPTNVLTVALNRPAAANDVKHSVRVETSTDANGEFSFDQMPLYDYRVSIESADGQLSGMSAGLSFSPLGTPELKNNFFIDFRTVVLRGTGSISGRALDENDKPIKHALVEVLTRLSSVASFPVGGLTRETDDNGEFRFVGLAPGEYFLRISPQGDPSRSHYPTTYYPGSTDPGGASSLLVTTGNELTQINVRLAPVGVRVHARIVTTTGSKVARQFVLIPRNPAVPLKPAPTFARSIGDDGLELWGVASGSYFLYGGAFRSPMSGSVTANEFDLVNGLRAVEWSRTAIEVGSEDVKNVVLTLSAPFSLTGRVTVDTAATDADRLDLSGIKLRLEFAEIVPAMARSILAAVDTDGRFQLTHLSEATLTLNAADLPDGWYVSGVRQDGQDVTANGITAVPGNDSLPEVIISNASGSLAGTILDRMDKPVSAGRFVLLPNLPARRNPIFISTGTSNGTGAFRIETLPPGEYTLIAFPDDDKFTTTFLRNLNNVEPYERYGQHVYIGARQATKVTVVAAPYIR